MTTAQRLRAIHAALLAAFDGPALAQLVGLYLSKPLEHIAGAGDLEQRITELLQWAEANGQMETLLAGAIAVNPTSPDLQGLLAETKQARHMTTDYRHDHNGSDNGRTYVQASLPRLERKIDELTEAVNHLATRVSVLEYQVKHAPALWTLVVLVALLLVVATAYAWGGHLG